MSAMPPKAVVQLGLRACLVTTGGNYIAKSKAYAHSCATDVQALITFSMLCARRRQRIGSIDGKIRFAVASNLDIGSVYLNYDNNILLQDEDKSAAILGWQQDHVARSDPVDLAQILA